MITGLEQPEGVSNPLLCENDPTITLNEGEMAIRIAFPTLINAASPLGSITNAPYSLINSYLAQVSSFIPGLYRGNYKKLSCDVFVVESRKAGLYLINTYPDLFSEYT